MYIDLTPELVRAGLAQEFVHRILEMRKQADLEASDRIEIYVQATPDLQIAIETHLATIQSETRAAELHFSEIPDAQEGGAGPSVTDAWFNGQWMKASIVTAD